MNDTKATNSTDAEVNYKEDLFCWTIEGVGILIIGLIGVFGNSCSMVLFSRQKVHRIFRHLLLLLSVFDAINRETLRGIPQFDRFEFGGIINPADFFQLERQTNLQMVFFKIKNGVLF